MKIIQQGLTDKNNEMRIKCSICQAIFDITADDVEKVEGSRAYYTTCPNHNCKRSIEIREGAISRSMLWKIDLRETK